MLFIKLINHNREFYFNYSQESKNGQGFLLFVVKPMGSRSSKLIHQSVCQCFRIVVLLVPDRVDHYQMPNSVVLT